MWGEEVKERFLTSVQGLPPSSAGYIFSSVLLTSLHTYPRKEHVHPPIRPQKPQTQQKREPAAEVTEKSRKSGKKGAEKNQQFVLADQKQQKKISSSTQGLVLHKHTVLRNCVLEVSLIWSPISEKKIVKKQNKGVTNAGWRQSTLRFVISWRPCCFLQFHLIVDDIWVFLRFDFKDLFFFSGRKWFNNTKHVKLASRQKNPVSSVSGSVSSAH